MTDKTGILLALAKEIRDGLGNDATASMRRRWAIELEAIAEQPAGAVGVAWAEGYAAGVTDERISEANIGIAGYGAKVEPARENPYTRATPPDAGVDVDRLLSVLPPEVRSMNGYDAAWAAGFNEGVSQARENISRALIDSAGGAKGETPAFKHGYQEGLNGTTIHESASDDFLRGYAAAKGTTPQPDDDAAESRMLNGMAP